MRDCPDPIHDELGLLPCELIAILAPNDTMKVARTSSNGYCTA